jgi:signal transduction histidine kinase
MYARRGSFVLRAAAACAAGLAVQVALAHGFLRLVLPPGAPFDPSVAALRTVTLVTVLGTLAALAARVQFGSPAAVARTVPRALIVIPPVAALVLAPLLWSEAELATWALALRNVAPVLAAAWASAITVATVLARVLLGFACRTPHGDEPGADGELGPPPLAGALARITGAVALAASVLVAGDVLSRPGVAEAMLASVLPWAPVGGIAVLVALASVAGFGLGHSPGRDVTSLARRLDALGYNTRQTLAWPVVVTSDDELGALLASLEQLRQHLVREASIYEDALERTRQADAAKSEFLGAVSHELRTPLNSVCGYAQLLLEEREPVPLTEAQAEDVRLIQAGGQQLLDLINDILDISMIESGELRLTFERWNPGQIASEVVSLLKPTLRGQPVALRCELGPELPPVLCDRRRVSQVLTNLVSNAIKFTERGEIVVRAAYDPRQDTVVISVRDTGIGIAPEDLDAIFEEYRQAGSIKRRKRGTGLGLAIARSIARHHGGSLTAESVLGDGSCFTLTLLREPQVQPRRIDMAEEAARARARAPGSHHTPTADAGFDDDAGLAAVSALVHAPHPDDATDERRAHDGGLR